MKDYEKFFLYKIYSVINSNISYKQTGYNEAMASAATNATVINNVIRSNGLWKYKSFSGTGPSINVGSDVSSIALICWSTGGGSWEYTGYGGCGGVITGTGGYEDTKSYCSLKFTYSKPYLNIQEYYSAYNSYSNYSQNVSGYIVYR